MAITFTPEVLADLIPGETLTMQARSMVAPEALLAAMRAFADALRRIGDLYPEVTASDGSGEDDAWRDPKDVGPVVPLPAGPVLTVDLGYLAIGLVNRIPGLLADRFTAAGVTDAEIFCPVYDVARRLFQVTFRPAARALFRGVRQPLDIAEDWLSRECPAEEPLTGLVGWVQTDLALATLRPVIGGVLETRARAVVVKTDLTETVVSAALSPYPPSEVSVLTAGEKPADTVAALYRQRDLIRRHHHHHHQPGPA